MPAAIAKTIVRPCVPEHFKDCDVVFSGLDADVAGDIEAAFRKAELNVFSNAKNFRTDPLCPLVVPLSNVEHLELLAHQRKDQDTKRGCIVTNANCAAAGLCVILYALEQAFGPLEKIMITTLQAVSGAGYPGVPSLDIFDNVVPYISGEESKLEWEIKKILGGRIETATSPFREELQVSATCTRVPVLEGHTESVSLKFARSPAPSAEQVIAALQSYVSEAQKLGCPSAPKQAIDVHLAPDRPQPRLDRWFQDGAGVSIGRIRPCPVFDLKFIMLSSNTSIGAATSSIINAEYALLKGYIS